MRNAQKCFSNSVLQALLQGRYTDPLLHWYLWHLEDCPNCVRKMAEFKEAESFNEMRFKRDGSSETLRSFSKDSSFDISCLDQLGLLPPNDLEEMGRLGDYRVLKLIGSGHSSIVFEAEDLWLNRNIVLKLLRNDLSSQLEGRLVFLAEAKLIAAIHHENVLPILNIGQENDHFYLVMPMLPGESLKSALANRPFSLTQALRITKQIASGLSATHQAGLLHCGLKPSNIWLQAMPDGSEKAVILDFGFAALKSLRLQGQFESDMAPEQLSGGQVDVRTDLYALGRLLLMLLSERTGDGTDRNNSDKESNFHKRLSPVMPILQRLLADDPNDRPADANQVIQMIDSLEDQSRRRWIATAGLAAAASVGAIIYRKPEPVSTPPIAQKPITRNPENSNLPRQTLATIEPQFAFQVGTNALVAIDHARLQLISARPDGTVEMQPISPNSKPEFSFQCGFTPAHINLCPKGQRIALVSRDGHLKVSVFSGDGAKIEPPQEIKLEIENINDMLWTDELQPRIVLATSQRLHFIDPSRKTSEPGYEEAYDVPYPPRKIRLRPGFQEIVCIVDDGGLMVWDTLRNEMTSGIKTHSDPSVFFAANKSGDRLVSSGSDGILVGYDGKTSPAKSQSKAPYWNPEMLNYYHKQSTGITFVSDSVVTVHMKESQVPSAQFLMMQLGGLKRECIMRINHHKIVRLFDSAERPMLYCMNQKGDFLACDLSQKIAQLSAPA